MSYVIVFDAAAEPFRNWWFPAFGVIFIAIGLLLVMKPAALGQKMLHRPVFRWFCLIFATVWTVASGLYVGIDNFEAGTALRTGHYSVVAGPVEDFEPMPRNGHGDESFDVNGVQFAYSDYVVTAGFNRSAAHGGPIRPGLPVRIAYKNGEILRLEIDR